MTATGPSIRAVCRIINRNSCGSGSVCGRQNGGTFIMTNAHVSGTQIGRKVQVEFEGRGMLRLTGTVIRAAYSNQISADWAIIFVPDFDEIEPVYLSRDLPGRGESMYTKGYPRCRPFDGSDIAQQKTYNNGVMLWLPDAISGQSGSGVYSDVDHLQKALLTWSIRDGRRSYGAGQLTAEIYRQNRAFERGQPLNGFPKMPGLEPVNDDFDFTGIDRGGLDDPETFDGFHGNVERGIADLPIWDDQLQEPDEPQPGDGELKKQIVKDLQNRAETLNDLIAKYQAGDVDAVPSTGGGIDETFGL